MTLNPLNDCMWVFHRLFKVCKELDYKVKFDNISDFSLNQLSIDVKDFIQNINLPFFQESIKLIHYMTVFKRNV